MFIIVSLIYIKIQYDVLFKLIIFKTLTFKVNLVPCLKIITMNILRLREVMSKKDITGKELALRLDITETSLSRILKGSQHPRLELLVKVADTLDVDIKDLFISTKPQKNPKEIIQTIKNSIEDLEALYETIDKKS